jgi:hypothetical protein
VVCAKAAGDDAIAAKAQAETSETDKPNLTINLILKARFPEEAKRSGEQRCGETRFRPCNALDAVASRTDQRLRRNYHLEQGRVGTTLTSISH